MTDIEKARELLAAELQRRGSLYSAKAVREGRRGMADEVAIAAIAAALRAAPEGFALVTAPKPCECHPETCACDSQLRGSP